MRIVLNVMLLVNFMVKTMVVRNHKSDIPFSEPQNIFLKPSYEYF